MKFTLITICAFIAVGCNTAAKPVVQTNNAAPVTASTEKPQTAISHTTENQPPPAANTGTASKWKQSGRAIDTKEFDTSIATSEIAVKKTPNDTAGKKALSIAYYKRGEALTGAQQYASALGDYRRALKYDSGNTDAKEWIDKITMIYSSMNRESPPEGEEPPPLPFEKEK